MFMEFSKMRNGVKGAAVLALGLTLAGCNQSTKVDPLAGGGGLAGSWVSGDNVFTAQLDSGRFISRANDTGETLSEGSYFAVSANEVRLNWRGNLSKQDNAANCLRQGPNIMNCTDQQGRTFSLRKTGAAS